VGVQDIKASGSQEAAQSEPGAEIAPAAEDQGNHREITKPGSPVELPPQVTGNSRAVAPLPHGQGFHEDTLFLSAPAQGGLGVQDG